MYTCPKSSKALSTDKAPMAIRILKLPGSLDFEGKIALQPASSSIVFSSMKLLFFVGNSLMNFAYVGICSKASVNEILICKFQKSV